MFKSFDTARDIVNSLSTVNEVLAFGAGIFTGSGTPEEINIKKFNHWISGSGVSGSLYHALYSANFSQSLSVELIDISFGYSHSSSLYSQSVAGTVPGNQIVEKNRVYRLFAKQLLGDESSFFSVDGSEKHELIFLSLRRSEYKDEIKKGTISLFMMDSGSHSGSSGGVTHSEFNTHTFTDDGATSTFTRSQRGDVANLKSGSLVGGLAYYQAGVLVLVPELISNTSSLANNPGNNWSSSFDYTAMVVSGGGTNSATDPGTFDNLIDAVRYRFLNLSIVNQSNLHSTFYFCRALNDEFNYSSNPTFTDSAGRIIPTSGTTDLNTRTYITKVGLLGPNQEVLGVAGLSKPLKKTPDSELLVKVRLDY